MFQSLITSTSQNSLESALCGESGIRGGLFVGDRTLVGFNSGLLGGVVYSGFVEAFLILVFGGELGDC